jgi:AraC-like DNA-binding protein
MREFILILCWLGVIQSLLLSFYFLSTIQRNHNRLFLGLVLLFTSIRAAKSTLFVFSDDIPLAVLNVGFVAHAALGPMLLLYVLSLHKEFKWRKIYFIHFIPAFMVLVLAFNLTLDSFWYRGGYSILLFYTLIYVAAYSYQFFKFIRAETNFFRNGIGLLMIVFTLFLLAYFSNYVLKTNDYLMGPIIYSSLIIAISFIAIRNNSVFTTEKKKYQNLNLSPQAVSDYEKKIVKVLEQEKLYLNPNLSLQQLADKSGVPGYALSFVLNEQLKTNFTGLINNYRINEAKKLLVDPAKSHLSIAGIAYECGFNTLSSFNSAFKKICGMTPSEYKKAIAYQPLV